MGFSISWIATKSLAAAEALDLLGLTDTGDPTDRDDELVSLAELPSGWLLLYSTNFDFAAPGWLKALSTAGVAMGCQVEEHVMFSGVRFFEGGEEAWAVVHDSEQAADHLSISGARPAELAPILERLTREQEEDEAGDVDFIFDIPIELAAAICGFRHNIEDGDLTFTALDGPTKAAPMYRASRRLPESVQGSLTSRSARPTTATAMYRLGRFVGRLFRGR